MSNIFSAILFLFPLVVAGMMGWLAWRRKATRLFWGLLAAGWAINVAGNVAWGVHDMVTGSRLPPLSWIDLIYLARYVCIALAFWLYPAVWPRRRLLEAVGVLILTALALWVTVYRTELAASKRAWDEFIGVAIYPVFDAGIVYLSLSRWRENEEAVWKLTVLLLLAGASAYGVANMINFFVRMAAVDAVSGWADLFWFLSDALAVAAMGWFWRRGRNLDPCKGSQPLQG